MSFNPSPRPAVHQYSPPRASPLRQSSNASTSSSAYSAGSYPSVASYASTLASIDSNPPPVYSTAHKRGRSEVEMAGDSAYRSDRETSPTATYKSMRQSLRPLPQPPSSTSPSYHATSVKRDMEGDRLDRRSSPTPTPTQKTSRHQHSASESLHRSGSLMRSTRDRADTHHNSTHSATFTPPDLHELQRSSTAQLRNLSKLTKDSADDGFSLTPSAPSVVGLHNRRQLKRNDSVRATGRGQLQPQSSIGSQWSGNSWFDQQRQFLQAYEYLCHIGEAKEWIEDVIQKPIPPIVQLEEALRDGVTLAEVVQALQPHRSIRIFSHSKLQFRHSDNIAIFFRFLNEVELPELFRFELIDLYEKKNIPKVIYCIHALSWLLYRNGMVSFRIGNLVGQLQFEHHELEEMQKGLDKAGISMPSFSGMGASFGAEPEPEPVETEEERIARELSENESAILDLQAQIRGCIVRLSLGDKMQGLWDSEGWLIDLQSRIRGDWSRQVMGFRLEMMRFAIRLQSATRGYLVRHRQQQTEERWHRQQGKVVALQSLFRARRARAEVQWIQTEARHHESGVRQFQAVVRGLLERKRVQVQAREVRHVQHDIPKAQSIIRGMLERRRIQTQLSMLQSVEPSIVKMQTLCRARHVRQTQARQQETLEYHQPLWRALQAVSRGMRSRQRVTATRSNLAMHAPAVSALQAKIRGGAARFEVMQTMSKLEQSSDSIILAQTRIRAFLGRKRVQTTKQNLRAHELRFTLLQSMSKGFLYRKDHEAFLQSIEAHSAKICQLQALGRAMILRINIGNILADLEAVEDSVEELQARARAMLVRARFAEKQRYFNENMKKVIKVQSYVRAKIQGEAYKSLTSGKNPPVGTVKNFVHLLNDSDFDFDEEVECERLRKTVIQHVRQNEMADQYIQQLDVKIALLVKNKITLDEVVKHQKHFGSMGGLMSGSDLAMKDPFDLKALNKNSRRKLEQYQELFFILQTQPQYLARMFRHAREQTVAEKDAERMRHLIMGLFGYAQKRREEYYLLKLISRSLKEEIDGCRTMQEYSRGKFVCTKLFAAYVKSPKDRKFMRDTIGFVLKDSIIDNINLDLESDPLHIYHKAIENEQLRTGQRSHRRLNVPREEAIKDPETKKLFITHLQDLRDIVDLIFAALEDTLHKLPFGVRYTAQQIYNHLTAHFQREDPQHVLQVAGQWVWKNYLQPAILEPEKFGATDRALQGEQKKNANEVAKVMNQIAMGRFFGADDIFLQPLNSYIGESIERLTAFWSRMLDVPNAEAQFDIDEFNDLYAKIKPTLYIKMADIIAIHQLVATDVSYICTAPDDSLRDIVRELGSVKGNESELMNVSNSEICLTLNPKLHDVEDPDAQVKALFMETKRCILYIIRVQSGPNLLDIMVKPILPEDEQRWQALVRDELSASSRKRGAYSDANTLVDIASMTYSELKRTALENILHLERMGRLSRHNQYQDILNVIAVDIRTKHRRRVQRAREVEGVKLTLDRLNDQATYLDQQLKTYNDYIEQAMVTLQNKKGKKRFLVPFTKQWEHERELQRNGRVPKFGSFKYSAQELANRGILLAWQGVHESQWIHHDLTISSNEVGVFTIEGSSGSIGVPGASAQVPLDDLLQAQYNGTQFLEFFGGEKIKVNVNLFLHLIMRKFYKDKDK